MTGTEILREVFEDIGVVGVGQTIPDTQATAAFRRLCQIIGHLSLAGITVPHVTWLQVPITSGNDSYTIGEDGTPTLDTTRPDRVRGGFIRTDAGTDEPLKILTAQEYESIENKSVDGRPTKIWYQDTYPNGTLYVWPVPTSSYVMHLFCSVPLAEPATAGAEVLIPRGYDLALVHQLALELMPRYGKEPTQLEYKLARDSKKACMALSARNKLNPPQLYITTAFAQYSLIEGGVAAGALLLE